ncbi:MAG: hypothetical protein ABI552_06135 [Casimicrobiaceae bacterium]
MTGNSGKTITPGGLHGAGRSGTPFYPPGNTSMNKLIVALVAGTFAAIAGAQTPPTTNQMKQQEVQKMTEAAKPTAGMQAAEAAKNVSNSKKHKAKKLTKKQKQAQVAATTEAGSTTHTGATTAAQGAANTAESKAVSPTRLKAPSMGTPAAESAMQKASKP